jgi:hypothetical protein
VDFDDYLEEPRATRKLKRHSQNRRVNYVDDFDYDDSQEEDYNADSIVDQEIPEDIDEDLSDLLEEDVRPRPRRREVRVNRRLTRQSNQASLLEGEDEDEQPQVMPRRRRRDISEEVLSLESDYHPRKKVKLDE